MRPPCAFRLRTLLVIAALLGLAAPTPAQVRRIQGKVVDESGTPVAGAAIEAALVAMTEAAAFAVRRNDQTWRARTDANGDYTLTVPTAGEYLVTALKDGMGSNRIRVVVTRSGLVTANLTLWKAPIGGRANNCGKNIPIGAFARSGFSAGAKPALARLLGWLEAVHLHTPGCSDAPAKEVGSWPQRDLEALLRDVRELVKFLQRVEDERAVYTGRGRMQRDQLIFSIHDRRLTLDELQRTFYGNEPLRPNDLLQRAAVLHADIAIFVPGTLDAEPLVSDGGRRGWRQGTLQWEIGRELLDSVSPAPGDDADTLLWYRAVSAHLFREGRLAELAVHLDRARRVFPQRPVFLLDSAYLHQELSSPAIQASVRQLRGDAVTVRVGSRSSELERTEHFFREALALAPDDAEARLRLGHTLGELGRHQEAAEELRSALDAKPNTRQRYFVELFLGRAEEALGRSPEARRRYEHAADLYPNAQSPRLALSRLARQTGDRATAQRALRSLAAVADIDGSDPWWGFYQPHEEDARILMDRMRQIGR